jgi:hypothetical protein
MSTRYAIILNYNPQIEKEKIKMAINGYTYQIGDLFTTSTAGVTGRINSFAKVSKTVTRVGLTLANGSKRFAMVKTSK